MSRREIRKFASVDISAGINRRARIFPERKVGHNLRTLLKGSVSILDATIVRVAVYCSLVERSRVSQDGTRARGAGPSLSPLRTLCRRS